MSRVGPNAAAAAAAHTTATHLEHAAAGLRLRQNLHRDAAARSQAEEAARQRGQLGQAPSWWLLLALCCHGVLLCAGPLCSVCRGPLPPGEQQIMSGSSC